MTDKKFFTIPCSWEMYGKLEIEAESLEEAILIADFDDTPLPDPASYIEESFQIDHDILNDVINEGPPHND